jgi:hypothetical protein
VAENRLAQNRPQRLRPVLAHVTDKQLPLVRSTSPDRAAGRLLAI